MDASMIAEEAVNAVKKAIATRDFTKDSDVNNLVSATMKGKGFTYKKAGTNNSFWVAGSGKWAIRWSKAEVTQKFLRLREEEGNIAEIMGRADIGPEVLTHGIIKPGNGLFFVCYSVIENFPDGDLASNLRNGLLTEATALKQVASDVKALICRSAFLGFNNLDIKPANIVLTRVSEGTRKVRFIDFGLDYFIPFSPVPKLLSKCNPTKALAAMRAASAFIQFRLLCLHLTIDQNTPDSRLLGDALAVAFGSTHCGGVALRVPGSAANEIKDAVEKVWNHYLQRTHGYSFKAIFPTFKAVSCRDEAPMGVGNVNFSKPDLALCGSSLKTYTDVSAWFIKKFQ
jgi:serine/threonine protein kinase